MNTSLSIEKTKDGTTTLYSSRYRQHYHNPNGAVAESRHVFFETPGVPAALQQKNEIHIFEMGFGTGLNFLLLLDYLEKTKSQAKVSFHSVEAYPLDVGTVEKLDFGENLQPLQSNILLAEIFGNLKPGLNRFNVTGQVTLELFTGFFDEDPLITSGTTEPTFDFVFHDPFSPEVNAGMWSREVFKNLADICQPDAVLSTYCAASSARAAMAVAGWSVARARGALGKREMTVASLKTEKLTNFKRVNEKRLSERFEAGDFG